MTGPTLEISGASIVCVGSFNPKILQPAWLAAHQLLREDESEAANVRIIHPEVVAFETDWLNLEVTRDRMVAGTAQEPYDALRDLVLGVLTLLPHTPIRAAGFNLQRHFRIPTEESWHEFVSRLAPSGGWKGLLVQAEMRSLTMEGARQDGRAGYVRVTVEPSAQVLPHGVYVGVNDHNEGPDEEPMGSAWLIELLTKGWEESVSGAQSMSDRLVRRDA